MILAKSAQNHVSKYLKTIQNEIVYGGYLAALVAPSFVLTVSLITNSNIDIQLLAISYFIPLIIYSYDYYQDLEEDSKTNIERTAHLSNKARLYPFILSIYVIILGLLLILYANIYLIGFILTLVLLGIAYNHLLKSLTSKIPAFKNFYTAFIWAAAGSFFPILYNLNEIEISYFLIMIFIFLKCLVNVIFFDLKDIKSDKKQGLRTLPVLWGKDKTINFLNILNLSAFFPLFLGIYMGVIPDYALIMTVFYFYTAYYLKKSRKAEDDNLIFISSTLADFEFILWPFLILLAQKLLLIYPNVL
ncbi:MAG: UbiA family prenyltransferase [Euryarchaeota archaeon]|nr:UbiA family prenyltransferase [Euryarchaeota archaeon]MBU4608586.1 UbiA family prenyltransferase [Euryarchaeota archaeon]MBV1730213.1 UbiA family prenyltransferase [Methanobacterium sp.]MBV1754602.1 UbiA family prenyltransferase [Methanobacterium sp.]MBV1767043.1 UbiA family prenyltransferase [Methanobacterium sp.]